MQIDSPDTQQLVVETRADHRSRPPLPAARRLKIAAVVHTLVLGELGDHIKLPCAVFALLESEHAAAGMHATGKDRAGKGRAGTC